MMMMDESNRSVDLKDLKELFESKDSTNSWMVGRADVRSIDLFDAMPMPDLSESMSDYSLSGSMKKASTTTTMNNNTPKIPMTSSTTTTETMKNFNTVGGKQPLTVSQIGEMLRSADSAASNRSNSNVAKENIIAACAKIVTTAQPLLQRRPSTVSSRATSFGSMDRIRIFDSGEYDWEREFMDLGLIWQLEQQQQQQQHQLQQQQPVAAPVPDHFPSFDGINGRGPVPGMIGKDVVGPSSSSSVAFPVHGSSSSTSASLQRAMDKWREALAPPAPTITQKPSSLVPVAPSPPNPSLVPTPPCPKPNKKKTTCVVENRIYVEVTDDDVLCQRGSGSRLHPGTIRYRQLVEKSKPTYKAITNKFQKTKFAYDIVTHVQEVYGGRFLQYDKDCGRWYILPNNLAAKKAGQALRDINTPEFREAKRRKYSKNKKNKNQQTADCQILNV